MPCRKWIPGHPASSCGCGTSPCPGCGAAAYQATYYGNVPALGIASLPLIQGTGPNVNLWSACQTASVLGFPACVGGGSYPCSPTSMITAAFRVSALCTTISGSPKWQMFIRYRCMYQPVAFPLGGFCSGGTTLAAGDEWRAINAACPDPLSGCSGSGSYYLDVRWTIPNPCTAPTLLTFSGAPVVTLNVGGGSPTNLYCGTSATVKDTP